MWRGRGNCGAKRAREERGEKAAKKVGMEKMHGRGVKGVREFVGSRAKSSRIALARLARPGLVGKFGHGGVGTRGSGGSRTNLSVPGLVNRGHPQRDPARW